jgi:hypothetical protein
MQPAIAFPYHDPDLQMFPHLQAILPDLKATFSRAYICPPPSTRRHAGLMEWLAKEAFFIILPIDRPLQIGEHFAHVYLHAARMAEPDEIIHLAYLDRLSLALQGGNREQFLRDVNALCPKDLPLIFQRSAKAWQTHPQNYFKIEGFVTTVGEILFGKRLDYAWCHLVLQAKQLKEIMPRVRNRDLSMVAEMILMLQSNIKTKDVDWLAWEDPFILACDAKELKQTRENSLEETQKRLAYTTRMAETMVRYALSHNDQVGHYLPVSQTRDDM